MNRILSLILTVPTKLLNIYNFECFDAFCVNMKDVHTELIQHRRLWMLKRGIIKGNLTVDSNAQRMNGSCPLMPEEVKWILITIIL